VTLKGHTAAVNWVGLSRDGRRALTASQDNTVKLWDAATGKELLTLRGHSQEVTAVEFSADNHSVLTGSRDGTAIVWLGSDWREAQPDVKAATPQQARAKR
jgi:WD40 repeat protein